MLEAQRGMLERALPILGVTFAERCRVLPKLFGNH